MTAGPVTRLAGLFGLLGLAPVAAALALGWRSLPEAALAASGWFVAVLSVSWLLRLVLESAAVSAERASARRRSAVGAEGSEGPGRESRAG